MRCTLLVFLVFLTSQISAQKFLTGKVYNSQSKEVLVSVSIRNISGQKFDLSEENGSFRIQCVPGDRVVFTFVGFWPDTLEIEEAMLSGDYRMYLDPKPQTLQAVRVGQLSNYQLDSMARRQEYAWIYDHGKQSMVSNQYKGDGVGVDINIFRNASSGDKQRERLKKRLMIEEEDYYIDSRFSRDYVTKLTHLQGDSLQRFMMDYRPTYEFCRKAAQVDILVYINDSYKKFKEGTPPQ
jgi:hypothetical protein